MYNKFNKPFVINVMHLYANYKFIFRQPKPNLPGLPTKVHVRQNL